MARVAMGRIWLIVQVLCGWAEKHKNEDVYRGKLTHNESLTQRGR
jgi:hypothetical protein